MLRERGVRYCGIESTITGVRATAVTLAEFAHEMRSQLGPIAARRPVVDRTGLTGRYDLTLNLGFLPCAAIASGYPAFASLVGPLGVRTMPAALEQQLGLTLTPGTAPYDVLVVDRLGASPPR